MVRTLRKTGEGAAIAVAEVGNGSSSGGNETKGEMGERNAVGRHNSRTALKDLKNQMAAVANAQLEREKNQAKKYRTAAQGQST